jgi:hypothetical protein
MALPLNPDRLRLVYDLLSECPPFDKWNLPHGEDVTFVVNRFKKEYGRHNTTLRSDLKLGHRIGISAVNVTTLDTLMRVMAHEMVHVHEQANEVCSAKQSAQHTPAFWAFGREVCANLGFNPDIF